MDLEEGTGTLDSDTELLKEVQVIESTNVNGSCQDSARYHPLLLVIKFNLKMVLHFCGSEMLKTNILFGERFINIKLSSVKL